MSLGGKEEREEWLKVPFPVPSIPIRLHIYHIQCRSKGESSIFVLDVATNNCVHYEPVDAFPRKHHMTVNKEIFRKHPEIQFRNDLIDTFIDICSIEVG